MYTKKVPPNSHAYQEIQNQAILDQLGILGDNMSTLFQKMHRLSESMDRLDKRFNSLEKTIEESI